MNHLQHPHILAINTIDYQLFIQKILQNQKKCFDFKKMSYFCSPKRHTECPGGGIGRRAGLKHQFLHWSAGSTPAPGTRKKVAI